MRKTCNSYHATYIYIPNENLHFLTLGVKSMCHYFGSRDFWNLGYHPSFWTPSSAFKFIWSQNYGSKSKTWISIKIPQ